MFHKYVYYLIDFPIGCKGKTYQKGCGQNGHNYRKMAIYILFKLQLDTYSCIIISVHNFNMFGRVQVDPVLP